MRIYGSLINNKKRIHLMGIGGVSMSAIAVMLKKDGHIITGSDSFLSKNVEKLREEGINVNIGANLDDVEKADLIIYTNAVPEKDPELSYARSIGKEIIERSDFMGIFTKIFDECISICGTHGKTTTTSMTSLCFIEGKKDPSIQVGAYLKNINSNFRVGNSEYLVIESCEYKDSFLKFNPDTVAVLNVDLDHVDYFKDIEDIKKSFKKFMQKVPKGGKIFVNGDDENIKDILEKNKFEAEIITIGKNDKSFYNYKNIKYSYESNEKDETGYNSNKEYMEFDLYQKDKKIDKIRLNVLGEHNAFNASISTAIALSYDIDIEDIKKGLLKFEGASRRFEYKGKVNGARVFDDYAHHPTEIKSLGQAVEKLDKHKSFAVFEIHTFTRAERFEDQFGKALSSFDNIIIAPIYRARKDGAREVTQEEIKEKILEYDKNKNVIYFENYEEIKEYLLKTVTSGDVIFTIGAGNVTKLADALVKEEKNKTIK